MVCRLCGTFTADEDEAQEPLYLGDDELAEDLLNSLDAREVDADLATILEMPPSGLKPFHACGRGCSYTFS